MRTALKKSLCALLAACFLLALLPAAASAAALGDVNADGSVNAADARLALRGAVKLDTIAEGTEAFTAADVNRDNVLTAEDARRILRAAVGLESFAGPVAGANEYDILRTGTFYLSGAMTADNETTPFVLATGDSSLYMEMEADGLRLGLLAKGSDIILIDVAGKRYWKPSALEKPFLTGMGMPTAEELRSEVNSYGFSSLEPLSEADEVTTGTLGGVNCTVYVFKASDGSSYKVYMDGAKFKALENLTVSGAQETLLTVDSISGEFPTMPPADYQSVSMLTFASTLMS